MLVDTHNSAGEKDLLFSRAQNAHRNRADCIKTLWCDTLQWHVTCVAVEVELFQVHYASMKFWEQALPASFSYTSGNQPGNTVYT